MEPGVENPSLEELHDLLKETHDLVKENHKLLKRMERNALISFVVKAIVWLLILGVPLFFLSTYLTPLISAIEGNTASSTVPSGLLGLPSAAQMQRIIELYKPAQK